MTMCMPTHVLMRIPTSYEVEFLTPKGIPCFAIRAAMPFYSKEEVWRYLDRTGLWNSYFACCLDNSEATSVLKHTIRSRARELFGLKVNSPLWLLADRYEESGMQEEADFLRTRCIPERK